jgi:urea transport system permease protein
MAVQGFQGRHILVEVEAVDQHVAVVLAFPNGLSGIWADYVQPRIDRLLASRKSKSGSKWADNSVADGAPAE